MAIFFFFVYVGTLIVMFCMVVRLAPNPLFRLTPLLTYGFFYTGCRLLDELQAKED